MQWIADLIHDFTEADRQKRPLEELIVLWPVHQVTFLKRTDDRVVVFRVFPNHDVFMLFFRNHFLCFLLPFFLFSKCSPK